MGKLVIFEIGEGSFQQGFPVKIRIGEERQPHSQEILGRLPPALTIPQHYYEWQSSYRHLPANWLITVPETQITNVSTRETCHYAAQRFQFSFNEWLNQPVVRQLERQLLQKVGDWQDVRFILQTQDVLLRRIPWHLWDIFQDSHNRPEIIVSSEYEPNKQKLKNPVKILVVLGNNQGIDIQQDLETIKKLPGAIIELLQEPSRQQLRDKLWTQAWDIFFFAGHSCSHNDDISGQIQINPQETLSLDSLRHTLRHAVNKGLKLAIFNSCDGIGLARNLADVRIPYTIVMREPVPDVVAQHFLRYFLTAFASGESLYASVQQSRDRLQEELENDYPCASWLPVIFQNPAAAELKYPQPSNWAKIGVRAAILTGLVVTFSYISTAIINEWKFHRRFSDGNNILVKTFITTHKQDGIKAFKQGNYQLAQEKFQDSLREHYNDPETLIYLNNAKVANQAGLKIGVAVPIGNNSNVAQEILRGVAQAQQEINKQGGIHGKFLKVTIANDDNRPEIAKQVAQRFVQDADILAVVGHNSSDASVPASDIYQAGKLVMVSPTSSSTRLTDRPRPDSDGNYIYRTIISFNVIAESLAEYAKTTGMNKIMICSDSRATDQSFEQAFVNSIIYKRLQYINNINCDFASGNFRPETIVSNAIAQNVDAILLNPQVDRMSKAVDVAKLNQGKLRLLGNPSLQTKTILDAGNAVQGMVIATPWLADVSPNKEFVQNAKNLWREPDLITWRTATAFDATKAIAVALKQEDNTRIGIQKAFAQNFSLQSATGTIQFLSWGDRKGDRVGNAILVEVKPDLKAPSGYSFVPKNSLQHRISLGDKILVQDNPSREKQSGVEAFTMGNYQQAIALFELSLQKVFNDPETHIYLQNSLAARSGKILKIAVSVPIGSNLNVAKEILQGVAQAQDEINRKGGIQGHLLQVEIASDDNNPEISQQLASYFVADKQILAVIGHNASDVSVAACPIYQAGKLVNISPTSFSLKLAGCGAYIFRTAPNIRLLADVLSNYAIKTIRTQNLAICVDEQAIDNQSFRDQFDYAIRVAGGNIVNINCDLSADDFNPSQVITEAISSGANGLVLAPHVDRINKALDIAAANKGRLRLFASPTLYTSQTLQQGQADVNSLMLAVPWHPEANTQNHFSKDSQRLWGNSVTWRSATSYDATVAVITGLQKSKTREGLQKVLRNPNFYAVGATGKIRFFQSGDRYLKNDAILVKIHPNKASTTGYKFSLMQ
ncbi:ABC transporter substrate-binding protein [Anabaena subtropica]|uniref:ABC transporter substrate-binding protein n=1 Tax=Anabaena subtropica FACHB-260 TaxID=2692884 RepID=A0ABR8CUC2_9NOST|nr:ABC transporter substrate-binding protein [Anabaena subtropica]MBD2345390.1 ABC transporter substrate-binding protein [Anabaena subtropica FACHB-260]